MFVFPLTARCGICGAKQPRVRRGTLHLLFILVGALVLYSILQRVWPDT